MFGQPKEDLRVADYVLGLMDAEEIVFFERDMRRDPALAARVGEWRERVARIEEPEADTPHARMRRRIEAGLGRGGGKVVMLPSAAAEPRGTAGRFAGLQVCAACFGAGTLVGGTIAWLVLG
jgi:anti-sigma-K factor RskA